MTYEELLVEKAKYPDKMTNAERLEAYYAGKEVDRIPMTMIIGPDSAAGYYGYTMKQFRESLEIQSEVMDKLYEDFGLDDCEMGIGLKAVGEALGSTRVYPDDGMDYLTDFILEDYSKLDELNIINPYEDTPFKGILAKIKYFQERYPDRKVTTAVAGPMTTAAAIRKPEKVMRDLIKNKEDLHRLLDFSVKCTLEWVRAAVEVGGKMPVKISDPVASTTMMNIKHFEEFSKPHFKDLVDGIVEITGFRPNIHICGKSKELWKPIAQMGVNSFSLDNIEDLAVAKEYIGDVTTIIGNVPPVEMLKYGSIDEVINYSIECLKKGADSPNGYMLGAGCQTPMGVPKENIEAMMYAGRRYGRGAKIGELPKGLKDLEKQLGDKA
ncbi:MAG: uroporphyrinogen decarboxylase family protein [Clostridioides sp.]|nr:uroporphyrinogen decarboxylase family protein [Clostridioides sp.]